MIRDADAADLDALAALFEAYRRFYEREPDAARARAYVRERLTDGPTRFFVAVEGAEIVGFVHLLPSFDTLSMRPMWILEDLFVAPAFRQGGTGAALLRHAEDFARSTGVSRMSLTTAHTNVQAQRVYERLGWHADTVFRAYHRALDKDV